MGRATDEFSLWGEGPRADSKQHRSLTPAPTLHLPSCGPAFCFSSIVTKSVSLITITSQVSSNILPSHPEGLGAREAESLLTERFHTIQTELFSLNLLRPLSGKLTWDYC